MIMCDYEESIHVKNVDRKYKIINMTKAILKQCKCSKRLIMYDKNIIEKIIENLHPITYKTSFLIDINPFELHVILYLLTENHIIKTTFYEYATLSESFNKSFIKKTEKDINLATMTTPIGNCVDLKIIFEDNDTLIIKNINSQDINQSGFLLL